MRTRQRWEAAGFPGIDAGESAIMENKSSRSGHDKLAGRIREALAFDDVLIEPTESKVLPAQTSTRTKLTPEIELQIPLLSSAMDTVTEDLMAIAMAQQGGMGVIHKNLSIKDHAEHVRRVKRFESGMVVNPVTVYQEQSLADVLAITKRHGISGLPVVQEKTGKLSES